jgi:hypothetical protein
VALAEKYRVHVDHQFGGDSRYVQIYKEGYVGSVTELTSTGEPVILDYPGNDNAVFDPIFGSELSVSIWNLTADQFIEFATAKSRDYLAVLYNDDDAVIEWMGWLLPSEQEEPWNQAPYETELIFNCGLGQLKDYDYLDTDGSYFVGRETKKDIIILDILSKIYPTTVSGVTRPPLLNSISLLETTLTVNTTNNALANSYINRNKYVKEDGSVWNCLDVLRDILEPLGARIQMSRGRYWWVMRLRDYALFYSGYNIPYQLYHATGAFASSGSLTSASYSKSITGPQARSTMVGWIDGSQRVRYERAFKTIRLRQDYGYRSLFLLGTFNSENWTDFWTATGGTSREQSAERANEYYINLGSTTATQYIEQSVSNLDWTVGDTGPRFTVSFEAMIDYADTSTYTLIRFGVRFFYDSTSNYYIQGQIGGTPVDPVWQAVSITTMYFTTDNGLPVSKQWYKFEFAIPAIPAGFDGDLQIRFYEGIVTGSGTINSWNVRNCQLMPSYDLTAPDKLIDLDLDISDQNIDIMPRKELGLGDVVVDNNEGQLYFGSLTTDSDGKLNTEVWRSTRRSGASRIAVGPAQSLLYYVQDSYAVQNGSIRKRLSGRMVLDDGRWIALVISEDSVYYAFTQLTIDLKRGECDVSMLELPDNEAMGGNLITGWTNRIGPLGFSTWGASGATITTLGTNSSGQGADANSISYKAYDQFRVQVSAGSITALSYRLDFAGNLIALTSATDTVITAPSSDGSDVPELESVASSGTGTGVVIEITRIYGF